MFIDPDYTCTTLCNYGNKLTNYITNYIKLKPADLNKSYRSHHLRRMIPNFCNFTVKIKEHWASHCHSQAH